MGPQLLNEKELEWSTVVANNSMNRERVATGINSYEKDINLNPIEFIKERKTKSYIEWTDLCCGRGKAIIQVSNHFEGSELANKLFLRGIDLVEYFDEYKLSENLTLKKMNLDNWLPERKCDLITIVHGLHYIGDKIDLIIKSVSALKKDGLFIGNLDLNNIEIVGHKHSKKIILDYFKKNSIEYNQRTRIVSAKGSNEIEKSFHYLGANDKAGPNYTGQPAVNSIYRLLNK